jgi:hypothetical protein
VTQDLIVGCGVYKSRGSATEGQTVAHRGQDAGQKKQLGTGAKRVAVPA